MKEHSVRPRKSANRLDFIRRANRSELRRLCDADGVHHVPVQLHLLREKFFCLAQVDLSVIGFRQKQLGSPSVKLRGASFVRLDVGTLVTDHAVKRLAKVGETKRVCRSTGKFLSLWSLCCILPNARAQTNLRKWDRFRTRSSSAARVFLSW